MQVGESRKFPPKRGPRRKPESGPSQKPKLKSRESRDNSSLRDETIPRQPSRQVSFIAQESEATEPAPEAQAAANVPVRSLRMEDRRLSASAKFFDEALKKSDKSSRKSKTND